MILFKKFELIYWYLKMAVLRVEFDNILCFDGFVADFTYPKKLVNPPLDYEYLKDYPNIRYKKVNILIGSNATGKTSLGKAIWLSFIFLRDKEAKPLRDMVSDPNRPASILMDCAFENGIFFRLEAKVETDGNVLSRYRQLKMGRNDTYQVLVDKMPDIPFENHVKALDGAVVGGWYFSFPSIENGFDRISCKFDSDNYGDFITILTGLLKTLDASIDTVFKSAEQEDTFIIRFKNGKTTSFRDGGSMSAIPYLSSGTKYAINIANVMNAIKHHDNGFYYVDEQFSYINSEIEIACLSALIELLGDGEQLFFTTHNEEVMNMPLPLHSFSFLKKKEEGDSISVELVNASSFEKRNNVNVKNLYDNDYFGVNPDTSKVFELVN